MPKKSLYIFLTSLLGVLLFLMLHRIAIFLFLYLLAGGYVTTGLNYYEFLILDYFSLIITLMLGGWYGIWLGLKWFERVYEEKSHPGFVHHLSNLIFPAPKPNNLQVRMSAVKEQLQNDIWQLEDLAEASDVQPIMQPVVTEVMVRETIMEPVTEPVFERTSAPKPIKKKVVRKKTVKKVKV